MRREEFLSFVEAHRTSLVHRAYQVSGDWHLAEDLVQTVLLDVYQGHEAIRDPAALNAYFRTALGHANATWWRRRSAHEAPSSESLPDTVTKDLSEVDVALCVRAVLHTLPVKTATIVVMRYVLDMSEKQVAEALDCPLSTVKNHASRGLSRLRTDSSLLDAVAPAASSG